jgi:TolB-like protein/cytochrome c-type biogenesis protein CcmH/NrfG
MAEHRPPRGERPRFRVALPAPLRVNSRVNPPDPLPHGQNPGGDARPDIPDFSLIRAIGKGSYGEVWLARGLTGVYRAIKIVWRSRFPDAEPFEREFKGLQKFSAMSLPEAGQLALLHIGQNEAEGFFYYVMELADDVNSGREINPATYAPLTLRELRERREPLSARECVAFGCDLARALAGLHSRGLVHRDIKPSNVVLVGGVPKLADVGLVSSISDALTYVGTEGFVPPEGPGRPAADVYALGKLLYELVTGLDRDQYPRLPDDLDRRPDRKLVFALNAVILRACEPAQGRRYRDASALLGALEELRPHGATPARTRALPWVAAAASVLVLLAAGAAWRWNQRPSAPPRAADNATSAEKSVAVLPFANLSEDKNANSFFSDGVHDDVLFNLGLVRGLRVVSRTSVMQFRNTNKMAAEIAKELGVDYLVEGSVQRAGNKMRVTAELINARADEQVWGQSFDRDVTDIFAVQTEIAQSIASTLKARLSRGDLGLMGRAQTTNPAAHDLYLKARALIENHGGLAFNETESLLTSSVQLDPNYAAAWAELSYEYCFEYFQVTHTPNQLGLAKTAIQNAVRLAPDDPEVIKCLGDYYYYCFRDYLKATEQYLKLVQLRPNDPETHIALGFLQRRQGKWADALSEFRLATRLDPRSHKGRLALVSTLDLTRRFDEARAIDASLVRDFPKDVYILEFYSVLSYRARGSRADIDELARHKDDLDADDHDGFLMDRASILGDASGFIRLAESRHPNSDEFNDYVTPTTLAVAYAEAGDERAAQAEAGRVLDVMRGETVKQPDNGFIWAYMGVAYSLKGERDEALRCADKAVEIVPESRDSLDGPSLSLLRASVLARIGESTQALNEIARLLRKPADVNVYLLRLGFAEAASFKALRGDPRFAALLADPANNAPVPLGAPEGDEIPAPGEPKT